MSDLSRIGTTNTGLSIEDSAKSVEKIAYDAQDIVDQVMETRERRNSFLRYFFPDPRELAIIEAELSIIKSDAKFRRAVVEKINNAKIQALTERLIQHNRIETSSIRADATIYHQKHFQDLQKRTIALSDEYLNFMEKAYEDLDSIKVPWKRQKKEKLLNQLVESFESARDFLLKDYEKSFYNSI